MRSQVRDYPSGMVTQNTVISFEQLVQDFDSLFRRRVFRLETLDCYDAPNEHEPYARSLRASQPTRRGASRGSGSSGMSARPDAP